MTESVSFAEFLEQDFQPPGIRRDIDLLARLEERAALDRDWSDIKDFAAAPAEVRARLAAAFPHGPVEMLDLMTDGHAELYLDNGIKVDGRVVTVVGSGGPVQQLDREFDFADGVLHLEWLEINPQNQNDGAGTRILLGTYKAAKRLGMRTMRLTAVEAGSYVWAKAGFLADRHDVPDVRATAADRLAELAADLPQSDWLAAQRIVDGNGRNPKMLWRLADLQSEELSWQLLAFNSWSGTFTVGDAEQEARLIAYAKSRGAPAD